MYDLIKILALVKTAQETTFESCWLVSRINDRREKLTRGTFVYISNG